MKISSVFWQAVRAIGILSVLLIGLAGESVAQDEWEAFLTQRDGRALARDGNFIWIATSGGALRWEDLGRDVNGRPIGEFRTFSTVDGLASVDVVDIAVTADGAKWFAHGEADAGVSVLESDGTWHPIGTFQGLALEEGKRVNTIAASSESVWVGTESGATLFLGDRRDILLTQDDDGILSDNVLAIATAEGFVWLGTDRGLSRFGTFGADNFTVADSLPSNRVTVLTFGPDGALWIGTSKGIAIYDNGRISIPDGLGNLSGPVIRAISFEVTESDTIPWFATNEGPYRGNELLEDQRSGQSQALIPLIEETNDLLVDETGEIWFAHGNFWIYHWTPLDQLWDTHRLPGLVSNFIADIVVDLNGFVWTANAENVSGGPDGEQKGLHLMTPAGWTNIATPVIDSRVQTIVACAVDSVGNRWFTSRRATESPGSLIKLPASVTGIPQAGDFEYIHVSNLSTGFQTEPAYNVEVDGEGSIWVPVTKEGIAVLKADGITWESYSDPLCLRPEDDFDGPSALDVTFTPDGRAWVALERSFSTIIDPDDGDCFNWTSSNSTLPTGGLRTVRADARGRVWFGANAGLHMFDPGDSTWWGWTEESTDGRLPGNIIRDIGFDRRGNIWVGTFGGGIGVLSPDLTNWFEPYRVQTNLRRGSGLTSDFIMDFHMSVNSEGKDEIWIATFGGGVNRVVPDFEITGPPGGGAIPLTLAYPNPYVDGEADAEGVAFRDTPAGSVITIHDLSGKLIIEIQGPAFEGGAEPLWDFTNSSRVPVASGTYLFLIKKDGSVLQDGRIAYIR